MSGLFSSLNSISQALDANSLAISVVSQNLANLNNPSYARENVVFSNGNDVQTAQGTQSLGVEATVEDTANAVLNQQVMNEASLVNSGQTQTNLLQMAQAALGESISNSSSSGTSTATSVTDTGLGSSLDSFLTAFQALAADPTDAGTRDSVVQQAAALVNLFNTTDSNLANVQASATSQISSGVTTANGLLKQIAGLNTQIASIEAGGGGEAVSLRDDREADLEQLAAIIPVQVTAQTNGEDLVTTPDSSGNPVTLVQAGNVAGSLAYDATTGTLTGGSPATTLGPGSGSIQGAMSVATGPLQDLQTSLDSLANQIVTSVNGAYNPGGTGNNFFDASGTTAGTIALDPSLNESTLTAGTGAAGDNSIATAVAALAGTTFSTTGGDAIDGTFDSYYATTVSNLGNTVASANSNLTEQTQIQTMVTNQRSSVSGVNMDEEMANLVQYQQAYQASSQAFGVVNQMLNSLIQSLGSG